VFSAGLSGANGSDAVSPTASLSSELGNLRFRADGVLIWLVRSRRPGDRRLGRDLDSRDRLYTTAARLGRQCVGPGCCSLLVGE
jgi:hypothetical protein